MFPVERAKIALFCAKPRLFEMGFFMSDKELEIEEGEESNNTEENRKAEENSDDEDFLYAQKLRDAEIADEELEGEEDEEEEEALVPENERQDFVSRLLLQQLPERARKAEDILRKRLSGAKVHVLLNPVEGDSGESYVFDWSAEEASCIRGTASDANCTLRLSSQELERIARGVVNPQIALLSHRVKVEGDASFAMYFFNLVASPKRDSGSRSDSHA